MTTNGSSGGFRLTGPGKFLLFLVGLAVLAYAAWIYRDRLPTDLFSKKEVSTTAAVASEPAARAGSAERKGVLGHIRQTGVMRVGMEPDAPPLHFLNDRKQEDGFDFRLAASIAEEIGAQRVQVVEADYEELPGKLTDGEIDVIMAGYVPDPSIEGVVWSNGYLDFGLCMIVHEGMASTFRSPSDLSGKRVAIYDDPAAERWVKENIPNARISKFSGDDGWFEAVENDQADALIYDYPFAAEEIKSHPRTIIVKYNLNESKYAVGIPEGNFDLVYEVNAAIDKFRSSPRYADLMRE
ncbi:MAG TPA: ABC transporter substrate-binding protein, partial [Thermoanaerobaculia bacterium]|nr:ABC transporter substrate-binding protein [Thermoanaerobaculia bacterium]